MSFIKNKTILITGATGGIGSQLVEQLSHYQCHLVLVARRQSDLQGLIANFEKSPCSFTLITCDLSDIDAISALTKPFNETHDALDIIINLAGIELFDFIENQDNALIEQMIAVNLTAPILITKQLINKLKSQPTAHIINVGSIFGSLGYAHFSAYSATKFGLRGFTESMRRELQNSHIKLSYIAPRAVDTPMISAKLHAYANDVKMVFDPAEKVAGKIIDTINHQPKNVFIGFAETFFCIINTLFPSIIDSGLRAKNNIAESILSKQ